MSTDNKNDISENEGQQPGNKLTPDVKLPETFVPDNTIFSGHPDNPPSTSRLAGNKTLLFAQRILIVLIAVTAIVLLCLFLTSPSKKAARRASDSSQPVATRAFLQHGEQEQLDSGTSQQVDSQPPANSAKPSKSQTSSLAMITSPPTRKHPAVQKPITPTTSQATKHIEPSAISADEPLSLQLAQNFEKENSYEKASDIYGKLAANLIPTTIQQQFLADFLQFKIACCLMKTNKNEQALHLFKILSDSPCPTIRCLAAYNCLLLELKNKQYLLAATGSYKALALFDLVNLDEKNSSVLFRNCQFLCAQSLTQHVLSLSDVADYIPPQLWDSHLEIDPFENASAEKLSAILDSGSQQLQSAILAPQIKRIDQPDGSPARWSACCYRASIEQLLATFASAASLDVSWKLPSNSQAAADNIKNRTVTLYLSAATTQQLVATAAGSVGLLATTDQNNLVTVSNPAYYTILSEHIRSIANYTIPLWQQFLVRFSKDNQTASVRFALGLLYTRTENTPEAVTEYKILANRFSRSPIAPFALLNSSKLKTATRDFTAARQDLASIIEQYPNAPVTDSAFFCLADATMKASLFSAANQLYQKIYNLAFSPASQAKAAFGAANCCYELNDYVNTEKWLTKYLNLTKDKPDENLYRTHFMLAKSYLAAGNTASACQALQTALKGQLSPEQYTQAVTLLVDAYIMQNNFVEALNLLKNIDRWRLPQKENTEILLLQAAVYREMGLVDKAFTILADKTDYIAEPTLKARILLELGRCYKEDGRLELARRALADALLISQNNPVFSQVSLELADVCLKMDQNQAAARTCLTLLKSNCPDPVKQKAVQYLAQAYTKEKNYEKAALALAGRWQDDGPEQTKKQ